MPYYEYRCRANGEVLEVRHGMDHLVETWGELAELASRDPGGTPQDAPVERLMSAPVAVSSKGDSPGAAGFEGCGLGCACAHQA